MPDTNGLSGDQLRRLRAVFSGEIVTPADDGYDEARRLWNAMFDRRPAVVVRPTTSEEVATAIRFAREHDLEIAVRSGGRSASGHSGTDGGLVVDLSRDDPSEDEGNRGWVREAMRIVEPDAIEGRYANENADAGPGETRAIYGEAKVARLARLKRGWDPDNVFRLNHNVTPSAG